MIHKSRLFVIIVLLLIAVGHATNTQAATALKIEDFTLRGDLVGIDITDLHQQRLAQADEQLREALAADSRFTLVDNAQDAELILKPWVYRVSALILALHVELRSTDSGDVVSRRAVDFRGDNDIGWQRALAVLLRDWP